MPQLAENRRTAIKAGIKRGSARARAAMNRLDGEVLTDLDRIYRQAAVDLQAAIHGYAGSDGSVRLEVLQDLLGQVNGRLQGLSAARNRLLEDKQFAAADLAVQPFTGVPQLGASLTRVPEDAVRFARNLVAEDGLQISDRLWRLDRGAREGVGQAIERAVIQGHSASRAADDFILRGERIPPDVAAKMGEAQAGKIATSAASALLTGEGNPRANALRLFRTEMNRAHGEAYRAAAFETPGVIGTRYLLSPNHPRPDICNMHSSVNRYGLGPGVYPKGKSPWPAHPNTLSYEEVVFDDEIGQADRVGKEDRISWLKTQTPAVQEGVLGGRRKRAALIKGVLRENEISTPWRVLKKRYLRRGIEVDLLVIDEKPKEIIGAPLLFGQIDGMREYMQEAWATAPSSMHAVVKRVVPPDRITVTTGGGSYYQSKHVVLDLKSTRRADLSSKYDVYRHEYGHHLDFWITSKDGKTRTVQASMTPASKGGLHDAIVAARESLHARTKAQKARRVRLRQELIDLNDTMVADIFGALTKNKVGWGHSKSYLSRPGFAETEVFANMTDLFSRENQSAWLYLERELPDLTDAFKAFIDREGKL